MKSLIDGAEGMCSMIAMIISATRNSTAPLPMHLYKTWRGCKNNNTSTTKN
jgi:hypothetical protein